MRGAHASRELTLGDLKALLKEIIVPADFNPNLVTSNDTTTQVPLRAMICKANAIPSNLVGIAPRGGYILTLYDYYNTQTDHFPWSFAHPNGFPSAGSLCMSHDFTMSKQSLINIYRSSFNSDLKVRVEYYSRSDEFSNRSEVSLSQIAPRLAHAYVPTTPTPKTRSQGNTSLVGTPANLSLSTYQNENDSTRTSVKEIELERLDQKIPVYIHGLTNDDIKNISFIAVTFKLDNNPETYTWNIGNAERDVIKGYGRIENTNILNPINETVSNLIKRGTRDWTNTLISGLHNLTIEAQILKTNAAGNEYVYATVDTNVYIDASAAVALLSKPVQQAQGGTSASPTVTPTATRAPNLVVTPRDELEPGQTQGRRATPTPSTTIAPTPTPKPYKVTVKSANKPAIYYGDELKVICDPINKDYYYNFYGTATDLTTSIEYQFSRLIVADPMSESLKGNCFYPLEEGTRSQYGEELYDSATKKHEKINTLTNLGHKLRINYNLSVWTFDEGGKQVIITPTADSVTSFTVTILPKNRVVQAIENFTEAATNLIPSWLRSGKTTPTPTPEAKKTNAQEVVYYLKNTGTTAHLVFPADYKYDPIADQNEEINVTLNICTAQGSSGSFPQFDTEDTFGFSMSNDKKAIAYLLNSIPEINGECIVGNETYTRSTLTSIASPESSNKLLLQFFVLEKINNIQNQRTVIFLQGKSEILSYQPSLVGTLFPAATATTATVSTDYISSGRGGEANASTPTLTLIPSSASISPSSTPTTTPSPTPQSNQAAKACEITGVRWSRSSAIQGERIVINATATESCTDKQISFTVAEKDPIASHPAQKNPSNALCNKDSSVENGFCRAATQWVVEYIDDGFLSGDPEYRVTALSGESSRESSNLNVKERASNSRAQTGNSTVSTPTPTAALIPSKGQGGAQSVIATLTPIASPTPTQSVSASPTPTPVLTASQLATPSPTPLYNVAPPTAVPTKIPNMTSVCTVTQLIEQSNSDGTVVLKIDKDPQTLCSNNSSEYVAKQHNWGWWPDYNFKDNTKTYGSDNFPTTITFTDLKVGKTYWIDFKYNQDSANPTSRSRVARFTFTAKVAR